MKAKNSVKIIMENVADVTPNDSADLSQDSLIYVGTGFIETGGNLKVTAVDGNTVTFKNIKSGTFLPVVVRRVWATGTTVSDLIAMW